MALMLEKSDRCQMCGTSAWEWEEDRFAYAPVLQTCQGCVRREAFQDNQKEKAPGTSVVMLPKEQAATLRRQAEAMEKR